MLYIGFSLLGVLAGFLYAYMFIWEKKSLLSSSLIMLFSMFRYLSLVLFLWIFSGYGVTFAILWVISLMLTFWLVILRWPGNYGN